MNIGPHLDKQTEHIPGTREFIHEYTSSVCRYPTNETALSDIVFNLKSTQRPRIAP